MTSQQVGLEVLSRLAELDQVAYMRFASVYKDFQELTDFERELGLRYTPMEETVRRALAWYADRGLAPPLLEGRD